MLKYTTPDIKSIDTEARTGNNIDRLELIAMGLDDLEYIEGECEVSSYG